MKRMRRIGHKKRSRADVRGWLYQLRYPRVKLFFRCITRAMNDPEEPLNAVSKIDKVSRKVFKKTYMIVI